MIGSILASMFGCSHRRLTRPITPVAKPGEPSSETYVVCLDCGKQFFYDWDHMRIGEPMKRSPELGVLNPDMPDVPGPAKTKIKYALLGSAIPLAVFLGGALVRKRRAKTRTVSAGVRDARAFSNDVDRYIRLPHGGPGAQFRVRELIDQIEQSGRDYIIVGEIDCALADHPMPNSLDYWIRENFARNKETKQATSEVITQLLATGLFEELEDLHCPDTGHKSKGLRLHFREGVLAPAAQQATAEASPRGPSRQ